jgi:hypothetical protein
MRQLHHQDSDAPRGRRRRRRVGDADLSVASRAARRRRRHCAAPAAARLPTAAACRACRDRAAAAATAVGIIIALRARRAARSAAGSGIATCALDAGCPDEGRHVAQGQRRRRAGAAIGGSRGVPPVVVAPVPRRVADGPAIDERGTSRDRRAVVPVAAVLREAANGDGGRRGIRRDVQPGVLTFEAGQVGAAPRRATGADVVVDRLPSAPASGLSRRRGGCRPRRGSCRSPPGQCRRLRRVAAAGHAQELDGVALGRRPRMSVARISVRASSAVPPPADRS